MIRDGNTVTARQPAQVRRRTVRNYRQRILARFRALGHGVDARTARRQVHSFYRSSGAEWARHL